MKDPVKDRSGRDPQQFPCGDGLQGKIQWSRQGWGKRPEVPVKTLGGSIVQATAHRLFEICDSKALSSGPTFGFHPSGMGVPDFLSVTQMIFQLHAGASFRPLLLLSQLPAISSPDNGTISTGPDLPSPPDIPERISSRNMSAHLTCHNHLPIPPHPLLPPHGRTDIHKGEKGAP